ncbi:MAG: hypothetical protein PGN25_11595 [Methylorubrum populi]
MRELVRSWSAIPDLSEAEIERDGLRIRSCAGLEQWMVSGNDAAACRAAGVTTPAAGALGVVRGAPYAVRVGRDRILLVGQPAMPVEAGWSADGYLASNMSAGLHVFDMQGDRVEDIVRRACVIDPRAPGPCAAVTFAGVTAVLYGLEQPGRLRLHVDRGLAAYVWTWLGTACGMFLGGGIARA